MTITSDASTLLAAGGAAPQLNGEVPSGSASAQLNGNHVAAANAQGNVANGHSSASGLRPLDASKLKITRNPNAEAPNFDNLVFGHKFTPHMLTVDWSATTGWSDPEIVPYGPLAVSPAAPVFQYASGLFEGMKAYRCAKDPSQVRLFRPDMNMARMNRSALKAALPTFDPAEMTKLLKTLVSLDKDYVPAAEGHTLYLRPTLIGTTNTLGMGVPTEAKLYAIASPVGPYWKGGFRPVSLYAREDVVRAWPGGTGQSKLGANYCAPTRIAAEAQEKGYDQVLWLFGDAAEITEVGAMNILMVFKQDDGSYEVATPPLDADYVLPGVTRDSILALLRAHSAGQLTLEGLPAGSQVKVSERKVVMQELIDAVQAGKLVEVFGAGTAAIVSPAARIGYRGVDYAIPTEADGFGTFARVMLRELVGRQTGAIDHKGWSVVCE